MIREIVKDPIILSRKSIDATIDDLDIVQDLKDTIKVYPHCVGIAANMIGIHRRILVMKDGNKLVTIINPVIVQKSDEYDTLEGCLCHDNPHQVHRYKVITIKYFDENMKQKTKTLRNEKAQIIQHEMDHFEGILI